MKFKDLSQLNTKDREKKLLELELELIKLNTQVATGTPPKDSGQLKKIKKDIAKIKLLEGIEKNMPLQSLDKNKIQSKKENIVKKIDSTESNNTKEEKTKLK